MTYPVVRHFKRAVTVVVVAALVLTVSRLIPLMLPSAWREVDWRRSNGGTYAYVETGATTVSLRYQFEFEPVGTVLHRATRVTIEVDGAPTSAAAGTPERVTQAVAHLRTQFAKACYDNGAPELAEAFDTAWNSPKRTFVVEHPERSAAWVLMWAVWVFTALSATVFVASLVASLWLLPKRLRLHRQLKLGRCTHCGYDLKGTPGDRCPECGEIRSQA